MYVIILINDIILYISQHKECSFVCLNWSVWCVSDKTAWLYAGIGGQSHAQGQFIIIVTYKASKPKTQPAFIVGPQTLDRGFTNFFSLIFACLFQGSEHECGTDNQKGMHIETSYDNLLYPTLNSCELDRCVSLFILFWPQHHPSFIDN